jgi:lipopolysaccharide transport system permease protein
MEDWDIVIKPKTGWLEFDVKEIIKYRDLVYLFVKRNFTAQYKQTILGPLWFILNPLITSGMFTLIFGQVAGLTTDGVPQFAFYLTSTAIWQYFSTCLSGTASTFTENANIFGKVYFPRITVPISTVIFSLVNFVVVLAMDIGVIIYEACIGGNVHPNWTIVLLPLLVMQTAVFGLGCGIIVSSLTTKYRDLSILVSFGVSLWMYATPVVYSASQFSETTRKILMLNPMSPIVCNFRYALLGSGTFEGGYWILSIVVTIVILILGLLLFNRIEKTFMDTV